MTKKQIRLLKALNFSILDFFMRKKQEPVPVAKKPTRTKTITYKGIKWEGVKPLQDKSAFKQVEKLLGVKLPKELIDLVTNCNGGMSLASFDTEHSDHWGKGSIELFSYNKDDEMNIFWVIKNCIDSKFKRLKLIPMGDTANGDFVCLEMDGQATKILLLDHETDQFYPISTTLEGFLTECLYDDEDFSLDGCKRLVHVCMNRLNYVSYNKTNIEFDITEPSCIKMLYTNIDKICDNYNKMYTKHMSWQNKNLKKWYKEFMREYGLKNEYCMWDSFPTLEISEFGNTIQIIMYTEIGSEEYDDNSVPYESVFDVNGKLIHQGPDYSD